MQGLERKQTMIKKILKVSLAASMAMPAAASAAQNATVFAQEMPAEELNANVQPVLEEQPAVQEETVLTEETEETGTQGVPAEAETPVEDSAQITETPAEEEVTVPETEEPVAEEPAAVEEEAVAEEEITDEEELMSRDDRPGTNIPCNLDLDVKVDGEQASTLTYLPHAAAHDIQIGGVLYMNGVWGNYGLARTAYIASQTIKGMSHAQAVEKYHTKSLVGNWTYTFQINPEVVTVNEEILLDTARWQAAFREGTGAAGAGFFNYMICQNVTYNPADGTVAVHFSIDENSTGMVSTKTIDSDSSCKPAEIRAYSPAGAFTIKAENFKKDTVAVKGTAAFNGTIDMSPWMAKFFPLNFHGEIAQPNLTLQVADVYAAFDVENGTWADGSTDTRVETVPVDVFKLSEEAYAVAGTLTEAMIPTGMIAAEGYDQENGAWDAEISTEENGTLFYESGVMGLNADDSQPLYVHYTYSFPGKAADPKPVDPDQPAFPGEDDNKPGEDNKPGDTDKPGEDSKPGDTDADKPGTDKPEENKPADNTDKQEENKKPSSSKVPTAAATGIATTLGVQALSVAGIFTLLRRRKNR